MSFFRSINNAAVSASAFTAHYEPQHQVNTQAEWVGMLVKWVANDKARAAASNVTQLRQKQAPASDYDDDDTEWQNGVGP